MEGRTLPWHSTPPRPQGPSLLQAARKRALAGNARGGREGTRRWDCWAPTKRHFLPASRRRARCPGSMLGAGSPGASRPGPSQPSGQSRCPQSFLKRAARGALRPQQAEAQVELPTGDKEPAPGARCTSPFPRTRSVTAARGQAPRAGLAAPHLLGPPTSPRRAKCMPLRALSSGWLRRCHCHRSSGSKRATAASRGRPGAGQRGGWDGGSCHGQEKGPCLCGEEPPARM